MIKISQYGLGMKLSIFKLTLSFFLLISATVYAQPDKGVLLPFTSLSLGADLIRIGRSQAINFAPEITNTFTAANENKPSASMGLVLGFEKKLSHDIFFQLGMTSYFNTEVNATGHVWEFSLPEFDNFIYHYRIQSSRIMLSSKLMTTIPTKIHPYLNAELGMGFNQARGFAQDRLVADSVPMIPFNDHVEQSLSWALGVGFDIEINSKARIGLGYQFANLGKTKLGLTPSQATNNTLSLSNMYTHQLRVQLTSLFDSNQGRLN